MKKLSLLATSLVAAAVLFTACSKKEYAGHFNNSYNSSAYLNNASEKATEATSSEVVVSASANEGEIAVIETPAQQAANAVVSTSETATSAKAVKASLKEKKAVKKLANLEKKAGKGKSQLIALLLVLLVGGLGIHRFYLGYTWQGVVQLLTAGGCGIWALIDLIRIIMGTLEPKDGSYETTL